MTDNLYPERIELEASAPGELHSFETDCTEQDDSVGLTILADGTELDHVDNEYNLLLDVDQDSKFDAVKSWIKQRRLRLALGAAAASAAVTLTTNPITELTQDVVEAAPWVGGGIVASEVAFALGGVMMLSSIGSKIGNPMKIKSRIPEIAERADNSLLFKSGFWLNATGAVGDFAVISGGVLKEMPVSTYPMLGLTLLDLGATVAVRKTIMSGINDNKDKVNEDILVKPEEKFRGQSRIREATSEDLDRLAELDIMMFENAYGTEIPTHEESRSMLERRLSNVQNGAGHMMVCEVDGVVQGFGTYFRTDKSWEEFTSWEESTNNGTLDGVTNPEGKYAYVVNMTVAPGGSEVRGMQKILVNLMSRALEENLEYGYFVSRIPEFTKWLDAEGIDYTTLPTEDLDKKAEEYIGLTATSRRGKEEPIDYELRTYTRSGFDMGKLVNAGFSDHESLSYGVTFKAPIIGTGKPKILRKVMGRGMRAASKSTKLMSKI
jgi:hypothetical protein